jgi:hypothetical protein
MSLISLYNPNVSKESKCVHFGEFKMQDLVTKHDRIDLVGSVSLGHQSGKSLISLALHKH